jgi:hypothetical protein
VVLKLATHKKIRTTTIVHHLGLLSHTIKEKTMMMSVAFCRGFRCSNTRKN